MSEKSFFGMSGHFAVLSLFLRRGYNVAVPVVDVGDDAIVIDDGAHELCRLQVKSGNASRPANDRISVAFTVSRKQLRDALGAPLFYIFMAWAWDRWSFVLIPRKALYIRKERALGRLKSDTDARRDELNLTVTFSRGASGDEDAFLWGESLKQYLNRWSSDWPELQPDRRGQGPRRSEHPRTPTEDPADGGDPATSP